MNETCGVVYFATGRQYINEAEESAKSVKANTSLPVTLFTDTTVRRSVFDEVRQITSASRSVGDSIPCDDAFPYERNLMLDTDTYVTESLSELLDVLDKYEIAVCHAPGRKDVSGVPDAITEYNTGVIAYRRSDGVQDFFSKWRDEYQSQVRRSGHVTNQGTFTKTLYHSELPFIVLPPEYNVRTQRGYLCGPAKIVHGRHPAGLKRLAECLNSTHSPRVFVISHSLLGAPVKIFEGESLLYRLQMIPFRFQNRVQRLKNKIVEGGLSSAVDAVKRFIRRRFTDEPP